MAPKKRSKRPASKPAWELRQNRIQAQNKLRFSDDVEVVDLSMELEVIKKYSHQSPASLSDAEDDMMTDTINHVFSLPIDHPIRLEVFNQTDGSKHGQRIANQVLDPSRVGQAW